MSERPTTAFVLSLVGGIFILIAGFVVVITGAVPVFFTLGIGALYGLLGIVSGAIIVIGAVRMNTAPQEHVTWDIVITMFSIIGWLAAGGALTAGFILALIGGILGMTWKPSAEPPQTAQPPPPVSKLCLGCGKTIGKRCASPSLREAVSVTISRSHT